MKLFLKLNGETLGYSLASEIKTDPPMGCGEGNFYPSPAYVAVEELFRRKTLASGITGKDDPSAMAQVQKEIERLPLSLVTEDEQALELLGLGIIDVREEMPDIPLMLEIIGLGYPIFERIFPGQYAAYENSFKTRNR
ncbi:MAG: hypothetical protein WCD79_05340 [Chthoniobacteraceae bacterium]